MDMVVSFIFRGKLYSCRAFVDTTEDPFYIFIIFNDQELIAEFGDEISIKTNGLIRLPKADDYPELVDIRQTLFNAIKNLPEFQQAAANRI